MTPQRARMIWICLLVDGEASSPATATLSKGEWLILSHSVAKRLVFANRVGKNHLFR